MYINKAIIIGNLTRDPEMKALPNSTRVAHLSIATNRVWKDREGKKQESTDFHNVVVFGKPAENAGQYLKKGQSVYVEGRLQTRSWDGKDGNKQYRTEIVADVVQFGSKSKSDSGYNTTPATNSAPKTQGYGNGLDDFDPNQIDYPSDDINPEDIPF